VFGTADDGRDKTTAGGIGAGKIQGSDMKDNADCSAVSNAVCIILYGDMLKWLGTILSEKPACGFDCQKFVM
jgi:hypothetical protein